MARKTSTNAEGEKDAKKSQKSGTGHANMWTTKEQHDWLLARLPAFREALAKKDSGKWIKPVYEDWFREFPLDPPTASELQEADNDTDKAMEQKMQKQKGVSTTSLDSY